MNELRDRIIAVVSGNHEQNRATKICGLFPLYDACCWARIQDRYRENFAVVDIGVEYLYDGIGIHTVDVAVLTVADFGQTLYADLAKCLPNG